MKHTKRSVGVGGNSSKMRGLALALVSPAERWTWQCSEWHCLRSVGEQAGRRRLFLRKWPVDPRLGSESSAQAAQVVAAGSGRFSPAVEPQAPRQGPAIGPVSPTPVEAAVMGDAVACAESVSCKLMRLRMRIRLQWSCGR